MLVGPWAHLFRSLSASGSLYIYIYTWICCQFLVWSVDSCPSPKLMTYSSFLETAMKRHIWDCAGVPSLGIGRWPTSGFHHVWCVGIPSDFCTDMCGPTQKSRIVWQRLRFIWKPGIWTVLTYHIRLYSIANLRPDTWKIRERRALTGKTSEAQTVVLFS